MSKEKTSPVILYKVVANHVDAGFISNVASIYKDAMAHYVMGETLVNHIHPYYLFHDLDDAMEYIGIDPKYVQNFFKDYPWILECECRDITWSKEVIEGHTKNFGGPIPKGTVLAGEVIPVRVAFKGGETDRVIGYTTLWK